MTVQLANNIFSEQDIQAFEPAMKIGLLATVNPAGQPHLTMISTLKAGSPETVTWGQFTEGSSKQHVRQNPHAAFLIMTLDRRFWRGKARWTHSETGGPQFEAYNNIPMFRYNAYFGIHTVHYMDLLGHTGRQALPMQAVILAAVKTMAARILAPARPSKPALNGWTRAFFNKLDNLKFLAYLDQDGFPWIIPVVQAQADGTGSLLLSTTVFGRELSAIPDGSPVAVLGLALTMEDVLVRGVYRSRRIRAGLACAAVDVDWVYNPMPPAPGQIYPPVDIQPVRLFR